MNETAIQSFDAAIGDDPHLLILGSIPGVKSLQEHAYYAHPRNAFWPIMTHLYQLDSHAPYQEKLSQLNAAGVALWDVAQECVRPGSLDSNIKQNSVIANPIQALLTQYPSINAIAFNGQAAAKLFKRHHSALLENELFQFYTLPSTSPAHASLNFEAKLKAWSVILNAKP
ncbi:DNA-deoxyinosine glycosylase [Neptunomonas phycophila]|uniref:DNA-deoxyinosine glycosylase n=1 Tax=Neptunomonas phycophila TaxID=1572645 RepID=A0AAW7XIE7_9GAMM|nr:DNA-deoxyinosine glycosylase [Neptunomonas phycophila]MDO6452753.1 DNA-deoxyinosine glycosylase [Neptunomonas phycophila]